jgi:hypothetical protein
VATGDETTADVVRRLPDGRMSEFRAHFEPDEARGIVLDG